MLLVGKSPIGDIRVVLNDDVKTDFVDRAKLSRVYRKLRYLLVDDRSSEFRARLHKC